MIRCIVSCPYKRGHSPPPGDPLSPTVHDPGEGTLGDRELRGAVTPRKGTGGTVAGERLRPQWYGMARCVWRWPSNVSGTRA